MTFRGRKLVSPLPPYSPTKYLPDLVGRGGGPKERADHVGTNGALLGRREVRCRGEDESDGNRATGAHLNGTDTWGGFALPALAFPADKEKLASVPILDWEDNAALPLCPVGHTGCDRLSVKAIERYP